jgi:hypothetical protein
MLVLKIIQNMLKIGTPGDVFERAIDDFEKQGSSPRVLQFIIDSEYKVEGSKFLSFIYNYLIQLRSKIWNKQSLESKI